MHIQFNRIDYYRNKSSHSSIQQTTLTTPTLTQGSYFIRSTIYETINPNTIRSSLSYKVSKVLQLDYN